MKKVITIVNDKYFAYKEHFFRQLDDLQSFQKKNKYRGYDTEIVGISVRGKNPQEITNNIARQILGIMPYFYEGTVINFSGDSLCPLVMKACLQNFEQHPVTEDLSALPKPIILAPGGTLNLLPKQLGTNKLKIVSNLACGLTNFENQTIKLRLMIVKIYNEREQLINEVHFPWTLFAGARLDGFTMSQMECQSRRVHTKIRLARTGLKSFARVLKKLEPALVPECIRQHLSLDVSSVSYTTLPFLGPYRFKGEKYVTLNEDHFHRVVIEANPGLDAFMKLVLFNILNFNPKLAARLWKKSDGQGNSRAPWYHFREVIDSLKPVQVSSDLLYHSFNDPYIQLDGYPIDLRKYGLKNGGYATTEVATVDQYFLAARMPKQAVIN